MVAFDRFPADARPFARGCTELSGPVQCDESPDGRRLILQRADPPGRVDPSRVGTALETMGMSQEVECMLSAVRAELTPGIVQAIVPLRIQPAHGERFDLARSGRPHASRQSSSTRSAFRTAHGVQQFPTRDFRPENMLVLISHFANSLRIMPSRIPYLTAWANGVARNGYCSG